MKNLKKLSAVFLAFILAFSLCFTAFAAYDDTNPAGAGSDGVVGTADDYGKVTVSGIEDGSNDLAVTAYPIFLAVYDESGQFAGYWSLYPDVVETLDDLKQDDGTYAFTEAQLIRIEQEMLNTGAAEIYAQAQSEAAAAGYRLGDAAAASYTLAADNADGSYSSDTVAVGSYLVYVTGAEAVEYNLAVVSTYYMNDGGQTVEQGAVDMVDPGNAWMKADQPRVEKEITDTSTTTHDDDYELNGKGTSVNIGDTVDYQVTVSNIPHYAGDYPVFNLTDTLSDGLTYNEEPGVSVVVRNASGDTVATLAENTDYTLAVSGQVIYIDFVVNGSYMLNDYAVSGYYLDITYSVTLNENATLNQYSNDNDVDLDYSVDSTLENREYHDHDRTHTYTYDIDGYLWGSDSEGGPGWNQSGSITRDVLTKVGDDHSVTIDPGDGEPGSEVTVTTKLLEGAEFTLYTDSACTQVYQNQDDQGNVYFDGIIETDINGRFAIYGLAAGTYYLKETVAPNGYALNGTVYKIVIGEELDEDGLLVSWSISIYAGDSTTPIGSSSFTVENEAIEDYDKDLPAGKTYGDDFEKEIGGSNVSFVCTESRELTDGTEYCYEGYASADNGDGTYTDTAYQLIITVTENGANVVWDLTETATVTGSTAEIVNTTTPELPSTGGIGTTIFYIVGCLIIIGAVVLFVTLRRKNRKTAE